MKPVSEASLTSALKALCVCLYKSVRTEMPVTLSCTANTLHDVNYWRAWGIYCLAEWCIKHALLLQRAYYAEFRIYGMPVYPWVECDIPQCNGLYSTFHFHIKHESSFRWLISLTVPHKFVIMQKYCQKLYLSPNNANEWWCSLKDRTFKKKISFYFRKRLEWVNNDFI